MKLSYKPYTRSQVPAVSDKSLDACQCQMHWWSESITTGTATQH